MKREYKAELSTQNHGYSVGASNANIAASSIRPLKSDYYRMKTRKQQKHEMLIAFMANMNDSKPKRNVAPVRPKFISTLLSLFL